MTHETRERHTGAVFLALLERIARAYPTREVDLIPDSVSTHKTAAVRAWFAWHERYRFHGTPTSASWMNQIETWSGILARQALRRGSANGVRASIETIDASTSASFATPEPGHSITPGASEQPARSTGCSGKVRPRTPVARAVRPCGPMGEP